MKPEKKEITVEDLFFKNAESKGSATSAIHALKRAFDCAELTADTILGLDFCTLCNTKGIGRKTVMLTAAVACDLAKLK